MRIRATLPERFRRMAASAFREGHCSLSQNRSKAMAARGALTCAACFSRVRSECRSSRRPTRPEDIAGYPLESSIRRSGALLEMVCVPAFARPFGTSNGVQADIKAPMRVSGCCKTSWRLIRFPNMRLRGGRWRQWRRGAATLIFSEKFGASSN